MLRPRPAAERGHFNHGWLDTYHTFSFADYYDPAHMGFRELRVINEDRVRPGHGFGMHGHRDMEILTYVLCGSLEHRDSMGNGSALRAGELQQMSAGTGIRHSEANPSTAEPVHLYQIWLQPEREGFPPSYDQRRFDPAGRRGQFQLVATRDGRQGALSIHQDADVYLADLLPGQPLAFDFRPGRHGWLQVLRGNVTANRLNLNTSDGLAISDERRLELSSPEPAEVLLFDLP